MIGDDELGEQEIFSFSRTLMTRGCDSQPNSTVWRRSTHEISPWFLAPPPLRRSDATTPQLRMHWASGRQQLTGCDSVAGRSPTKAHRQGRGDATDR